MTKIAIVDDEADLRESVAQWLKLSDFETVTYETAEAALRELRPDFGGIVLSDIKMPGMDGMAFLRRLQSVDPGLPTILMTGHGDVPMAVEAMRIGAFDFIEKPFEPDELAELCQRAANARTRTLESRALRRELSDGSVLTRRFMGNSPVINGLRETMLDVAQSDGHVLIVGETGTGKSLMALALHACGPRVSKPLITFDCAAHDAAETEALLFGGGAGTEAALLDQTEGGTLCLENVESLDAAAQARLLQFLTAAEDPAGPGHTPNLRVISVSTRQPLGIQPEESLRDDLYYRLANLVLEAPPLRARGEDILTLFTHYTVQFAEDYGCNAPQLNAVDAASLVQAPWPGNVRQLINLSERAVLQSRRGENNISALLIDDGFHAPAIALQGEKPLKEHVEAFEKMLIDHALRRHQGSVAAVMGELALPRRTLNEKMSKYGLSRHDYL